MTEPVEAPATVEASAEPARGPDGKFLPAVPPESQSEPSPPKARDHAHFAERRRRLEDKAKAVAADRRAIEQERSQWQQELQRRDAAVQQLAAKLESWEKGNPLSVAAAAGKDIDQTIRDFLQQDTPEAKIRKQHDEVAALRKEIQDREEARARAEQERQQQAMARATEHRRVAFVQSLTSDPKRYPHLNHEYDEGQLLDIANRFDQWAANEGKAYTYDQAASELERLAKLRYDELATKRASLFGSAKEPSAPTPVSVGSGNRQPATRPESTARATPAPKPSGRVLTRDEEIEADLALLRQAKEKDRMSASKNGKAS